MYMYICVCVYIYIYMDVLVRVNPYIVSVWEEERRHVWKDGMTLFDMTKKDDMCGVCEKIKDKRLNGLCVRRKQGMLCHTLPSVCVDACIYPYADHEDFVPQHRHTCHHRVRTTMLSDAI
jgi:hypothetical protein